ncbi:MAG: DUF3313 family protein [Verrucomicrobia bacterium]|nr:DUF3313 family protein [Verrucomicrobiota bacterium]
MKKILSILTSLAFCLTLAFNPSYSFAKKKELPDITHDGLERVSKPKSGADVVYLQPGADLSGYNKIILLEPNIAFRKGWKNRQNAQRQLTRRISDRDMEKMIDRGKDLFMDEFTDELENKGYPVVHTKGEDVMIVRAAIIDLNVAYADPNNLGGMWNKVYTEGAGEATLVIELFDSITGQILVRGVDRKWDSGGGYSWRIPRSQSTNIRDARRALRSWAKMLAIGLDHAKEEAK